MMLDRNTCEAFPYYLPDNPYFEVLGMVSDVSNKGLTTSELADWTIKPTTLWLWRDKERGTLKVSEWSELASMLLTRTSEDGTGEDGVVKHSKAVLGQIAPVGKAAGELAWEQFMRRSGTSYYADLLKSTNPNSVDKTYQHAGIDAKGVYSPAGAMLDGVVADRVEVAPDAKKGVFIKTGEDITGKYVENVMPDPAAEPPVTAGSKMVGWRVARDRVTGTAFHEITADLKMERHRGEVVWRPLTGNMNKMLTRAAVRWISDWNSDTDENGRVSSVTPVWTYLSVAWVITKSEYTRAVEFLMADSGSLDVWRKIDSAESDPADPAGMYGKVDVRVPPRPKTDAELYSTSSASSSSDSSTSHSSDPPPVVYEYHTTSSESYSSSSHSSESPSSGSSASSASSTSESSASSGEYGDPMILDVEYGLSAGLGKTTKMKLLVGRAPAWT
jgi:hypothetical protein